MKLMAESGCNGVLIGFESVSGAALGSLRKGFNKPDDYARLIEALHRAGHFDLRLFRLWAGRRCAGCL